MKNIYLILFLAGTFSFFSACHPEKDLISDHDCTFVQMDENMEGIVDESEMAMMDRCRNDAYTSREEIVDNLIGEWELVGYVDGWQYTVSQPCSYLKFRTNELIFSFNNGNINSVTRHDWRVIEDILTGQFSLEVETDINGPLEMTCFSPGFMFGNEFVIDGNVYIYQKVR